MKILHLEKRMEIAEGQVLFDPCSGISSCLC